MSNPSKEAVVRIAAIANLVGEALALADDGQEYMLGAKLSDVLKCAEERNDALNRGG